MRMGEHDVIPISRGLREPYSRTGWRCMDCGLHWEPLPESMNGRCKRGTLAAVPRPEEIADVRPEELAAADA